MPKKYILEESCMANRLIVRDRFLIELCLQLKSNFGLEVLPTALLEPCLIHVNVSIFLCYAENLRIDFKG